MSALDTLPTGPRTPRDAYGCGQPARDIAVADLRLIYQLPLLPPPRGERPSSSVLAKNGWTQVPDPLRLLDAAPGATPSSDDECSEQSYQEYLYFHDFVQKFLYPSSKQGRAGVSGDRAEATLFRRDDLARLTATIEGTDRCFDILRHTLQFFETGIAVLTVELQHVPQGKVLSLAEAQTVIDHLRRTYVPFWDDNGKAMRVPESVVLHDRQGMPVRAYTERQREQLLKAFAEDREPLLFPHWQELMAPILIDGQRGAWREPNDERVPLLSFVRLQMAGDERATLKRIRHGDWIRLADAEEAGDALAPYNPDFIAEEHPEYFYDRFFGDPLMASYISTRHLFGGAHYSMVCAGQFAETHLVHHFRRHYSQLALIARFEYASLLHFSSRLTGVVRDARGSRKQRGLEEDILEIRRDFLEFTHLFRFSGVSSQIQGAEMFDLFRKSLKLDVLYDDVKAEIDSASDFALNASQYREAKSATALTALATLGLPLGIGLAAYPFFEDRGLPKDTVSRLESIVKGWLGNEAAGNYAETAFLVAVLYFLTTLFTLVRGMDIRDVAGVFVAFIGFLCLALFLPF